MLSDIIGKLMQLPRK